VLNFLLIGAMVWWMHRQEWAAALKPYFFPALVLKMLCGVLLGLLYTYYYHGGDTTTYHNASLVLTTYAKQDISGYTRLLFFNTFKEEALRTAIPFTQFADFSNSFYFVKLLSVINFVTSGAYYLNALYLSLFSFWGAARFAALLVQVFPQWRSSAVVAFLFFPSVAFWSAGLSKDALMYGSMCWVFFFALSSAHGRPTSFWQILLVPLILYIFIKIKLFYAAVMVPLLILYIMIMKAPGMCYLQRGQQVKSFLFAVAGGLLLATLLHDFLPIDFLLEQSTNNYFFLLKKSLHGPHIVLESMEPTIKGMAYSYPEAFLSAVYRPFLGEAWEPLYMLLGLENLLLLLLTVLAIASLFKKANLKIEPLHVLLLLLVLLLGGIVGLTTPNFGSLSRYRIVFLPFLVYLLLQNRLALGLLQRLRL
jgi:hypothetical protein